MVLSEGTHDGFEWATVSNDLGYRCGYIKVLPEHPWHGKEYAHEIFDGIEVHGGLTFAEPDTPCGKGDDDGWWVGFDCAHSGDAADPALSPRAGQPRPWETIKTLQYVESECKKLCEQASHLLKLNSKQS